MFEQDYVIKSDKGKILCVLRCQLESEARAVNINNAKEPILRGSDPYPKKKRFWLF